MFVIEIMLCWYTINIARHCYAVTKYRQGHSAGSIPPQYTMSYIISCLLKQVSLWPQVNLLNILFINHKIQQESCSRDHSQKVHEPFVKYVSRQTDEQVNVKTSSLGRGKNDSKQPATCASGSLCNWIRIPKKCPRLVLRKSNAYQATSHSPRSKLNSSKLSQTCHTDVLRNKARFTCRLSLT